MTAVVASPRPPPQGGANRTPHRPAPPVTSRRLGALGNTEDKEQTARNTALSARMLELGESIVSIHDSTMINVRAKMAQLAARLKESKTSAADCEDGFVWSQPCDWDFESLIGKFEYKLSVAEIAALAAIGEYDAAPTRLALQELAASKLGKRSLGLKRGEIKPTDKHADEPISDHCVTLYEFLHADVLGHAREELSRTDAGIARLLNTIQYHKEEREAAIKDTKTADAERHHHAMIDAYLELLQIMDTRLKQLALTSNDTLSFRGQAQQGIDEARESFDRFGDASKRLQDAAAEDIAKANTVRKDEDTAHKDACAAHRLYVKNTSEALEANASDQEAAFAEIVRLIEHMRGLSEKRLKTLTDAAAEKQREEVRIANYNEFVQVQTEHLQYLERIKDQADNYNFAAAGLLEYLAEMDRKIAAKDVESELQGLCVDEAQRYLNYYRQYVLTAGDLVTKKELRTETLARQRRLAQLQKDTALESLDPDVHVYAQRQVEIDTKTEQLEHSLAQLRDEMEMCAINYQVADEILLKNGVEFEHPHAERGERAADDKKRYVAKTIDFVSEEENAVERHKDQLRKIKSLSENEKHQRKAARKGPAGSPSAKDNAAKEQAPAETTPADEAQAADERPAPATATAADAQEGSHAAETDVNAEEEATTPPQGAREGNGAPAAHEEVAAAAPADEPAVASGAESTDGGAAPSPKRRVEAAASDGEAASNDAAAQSSTEDAARVGQSRAGEATPASTTATPTRQEGASAATAGSGEVEQRGGSAADPADGEAAGGAAAQSDDEFNV